MRINNLAPHKTKTKANKKKTHPGNPIRINYHPNIQHTEKTFPEHKYHEKV